MHVVSTNQILDILHFNNKEYDELILNSNNIFPLMDLYQIRYWVFNEVRNSQVKKPKH